MIPGVINHLIEAIQGVFPGWRVRRCGGVVIFPIYSATGCPSDRCGVFFYKPPQETHRAAITWGSKIIDTRDAETLVPLITTALTIAIAEEREVTLEELLP